MHNGSVRIAYTVPEELMHKCAYVWMPVAIIGDLCHLIVFEIASFNIIMKYRRMQLFRIITIFGPLVFDWFFFPNDQLSEAPRKSKSRVHHERLS